MTDVNVSKIVVKMGKQKVELTLEEARDLQTMLNDVFGASKVIYIPGAPIVIPYPSYPYPPAYRRYWDTTYISDGTDGTLTWSSASE